MLSPPEKTLTGYPNSLNFQAISCLYCPHLSAISCQDETGIFWDNDSLAGLLAGESKSDLLIILSDVDGLYTGPPTEPFSQIINTYISEKHSELVTFGAKSRVGRGGMVTKVGAALKAAESGVPVVVARSKSPLKFRYFVILVVFLCF